MKKLYYLVICLPLVFTACNKGEIERLEAENAKLKQEVATDDATISEFLASFTAIEENLNTIKTKENAIAQQMSDGDLKGSRAARINFDINLIDSLLNDNQERIGQLERRLGSSNKRVKELKQLVETLKLQIVEKDKDISFLSEELSRSVKLNRRLTRSVDSLGFENTNLGNNLARTSDQLENQIRKANEVFYVVGTAKELMEKGIVNKQGGFLGIGRKTGMEGDFKANYFVKADKTIINEIEIGGKKAKVVSPHDESSYRIQMDGKVAKSLMITNPDKFWSKTPYLVIQKQ